MLAPAKTDAFRASFVGKHAAPVPIGTTMPSMLNISAQFGAKDIDTKGVIGGCGNSPKSVVTLPFVHCAIMALSAPANALNNAPFPGKTLAALGPSTSFIQKTLE